MKRGSWLMVFFVLIGLVVVQGLWAAQIVETQGSDYSLKQGEAVFTQVPTDKPRPSKTPKPEKKLIQPTNAEANTGNPQNNNNTTVNNPVVTSIRIDNTSAPNSGSSEKKSNPPPVKTFSLAPYSQRDSRFRTYNGEQFAIGKSPDSCSLEYAGCGPTSVAMILSGLDPKYDPIYTAIDYQKKGYYLGTWGAYISELLQYLMSKGIIISGGCKSGDLNRCISYENFATCKEMSGRMSKYLSQGWKYFSLGYYCEQKDGNCGHFVVVDSISNNRLVSYDPFYAYNPWTKKNTVPYDICGREPAVRFYKGFYFKYPN